MCDVPSWSAMEAVKHRVSHRTFEGRPLASNVRGEIELALQHPPPAPFGVRVRLALVDTTAGDRPVRMGTYGIIRGATSFLVGAVQKGEHAEEDFGFVMEWAILRATSLGLGTCWLGGTLRRGEFAAAMGLEPGEFIPAATPVGYAAERRALVDSVTRLGARSATRKPWETLFFRGDFGTPLTRDDAGAYATVLELVRQAPSASNRQPWRIVMDRDGQAFHLFLQRTAGYGYPGVDLQRIDMGIAMCHFQLSAHELGLGGTWRGPGIDVGTLPSRTAYVVSWHASDVADKRRR